MCSKVSKKKSGISSGSALFAKINTILTAELSHFIEILTVATLVENYIKYIQIVDPPPPPSTFSDQNGDYSTIRQCTDFPYRLGPNTHGLVTYIQVKVYIGNMLSWLNGG